MKTQFYFKKGGYYFNHDRLYYNRTNQAQDAIEKRKHKINTQNGRTGDRKRRERFKRKHIKLLI